MEKFPDKRQEIEIPREEGMAGLITLKEAAKLSGYAPDYVGQLIRKGKLRGRRIYTNAVWMTTKEDVFEYIKASERSSSIPAKGHISRKAKMIVEYAVDGKGLMRAFRIVLYASLVFSVALAVLLFYVFSSAIEKNFSDEALKRAALEAVSSQTQ